jgi:hypothetical protein
VSLPAVSLIVPFTLSAAPFTCSRSMFNSFVGGIRLSTHELGGGSQDVLDVMYALRLDPLAHKAEDQIDKRINAVIMFLYPKGKKLRQKLLTPLARELHGSIFDVPRRNAQPRALVFDWVHACPARGLEDETPQATDFLCFLRGPLNVAPPSEHVVEGDYTSLIRSLPR